MTHTHTHTNAHMHIYIYIYIYICVCVCVCVSVYIYIYILYKNKEKKRKIHINGWEKIYYLLQPLHFTMDFLRYEITKISGRKCVLSSSRCEFEFEIVVWTNAETYSKKLRHELQYFLIKEKYSVYKKSVCIGGQWRMKERKTEWGEEIRNEERKG